MTDKIYYVYCHKDGDEIVYIGKGRGNRAWSEARTNDDHTEWATNCIHDSIPFVHMMSTRLTSDDAFALEKELIKEIKPKWNIEHLPVTCPHCGAVYNTVGGLSSHIRSRHK